MSTRAFTDLPNIALATNFSASTAKAKLSEIIDLVAAGGVATITRRGRQRVAVLPVETVEALVDAARQHEFDSLGGRYDELIASMQTPEAMAAVNSLFTVSPEELGAAAGRAARAQKPKL